MDVFLKNTKKKTKLRLYQCFFVYLQNIRSKVYKYGHVFL
jgi:hypothetical protein